MLGQKIERCDGKAHPEWMVAISRVLAIERRAAAVGNISADLIIIKGIIDRTDKVRAARKDVEIIHLGRKNREKDRGQ